MELCGSVNKPPSLERCCSRDKEREKEREMGRRIQARCVGKTFSAFTGMQIIIIALELFLIKKCVLPHTSPLSLPLLLFLSLSLCLSYFSLSTIDLLSQYQHCLGQAKYYYYFAILSLDVIYE